DKMKNEPDQPEIATLINQGAEARIYQTTMLNKKIIIKQRFKKSYRLDILDKKINQRRMLQECRLLMKCKKMGINTPNLVLVDAKNYLIYMEFIEGQSLKSFVREKTLNSVLKPEYEYISENVGLILAKLHDGNLIHGDLTTSNFLIKKNQSSDDSRGEFYIIDFGLSQISNLAEEKAVDLYVLERSFNSTHPDSDELFELILKSYFKNLKVGKQSVFAKFEEVRKRGRKRT
ncbi:TP53 regulating kinase, partial [Clydaea vesicula]